METITKNDHNTYYKGHRNMFENYLSIRNRTEEICKPLEIEDYVVQNIADVSPPKWHLGHTSWFFETMILVPYLKGYEVFDTNFNYVFNSYYETIGARVIRTDRGNLSRPTVEQVYEYRAYVDAAMTKYLENALPEDLLPVFLLGLNHEQQHQELLLTDIKFILGNNPLLPPYSNTTIEIGTEIAEDSFLTFREGVYEIGHQGNDFCFDNELNRHKVYINHFEINENLVSNMEYLEFMNSGGYENFRLWHADGWEWKKQRQAKAPLYWHQINGEWQYYTLNGLSQINMSQPVTHINMYEAYAYANWKKMRLPTEAEWEVASQNLNWGDRWEWTQSAYLPYPGFKMAEDATGEYNGKFMINQMILRGASIATPDGHSRPTYRNFFQPHLQWQFTGIRLVK